MVLLAREKQMERCKRGISITVIVEMRLLESSHRLPRLLQCNLRRVLSVRLLGKLTLNHSILKKDAQISVYLVIDSDEDHRLWTWSQ